MVKIGKSWVLNGVIMFCHGIENHHTYFITIHKDSKGISYKENDNSDKTIYRKSLRGKDLVPGDYATMFVFLCSHFKLERDY